MQGRQKLVFWICQGIDWQEIHFISEFCCPLGCEGDGVEWLVVGLRPGGVQGGLRPPHQGGVLPSALWVGRWVREGFFFGEACGPKEGNNLVVEVRVWGAKKSLYGRTGTTSSAKSCTPSGMSICEPRT